MKNIKYSQLWEEEEDLLRRLAAGLHRDATVVEIGTAQGGSARIMAEASRNRGVGIYTFDIMESREARKNLRGYRDVRYSVLPSVEGARRWKRICGKKVDLIFIDGSHVLLDVMRDFLAWHHILKKSAVILFHDYDRPMKGGSAHFGVNVLIDAFLKQGVLVRESHVGRIISARPGSGKVRGDKMEKALRAVLREYYADVRRFSKRDLSGLKLMAASSFSSLHRALSGNRPAGSGGRVIFGDIYLHPPLKAGDVVFPESAFLYYVYGKMRNEKDKILSLSKDRARYFQVEELLQMLDHSAFGDEYVFDKDFDFGKLSSEDISRICAKELVRFSLLRQVCENIKQ